MKNINAENSGVDPRTSRMLSGRSTIWANPNRLPLCASKSNTIILFDFSVLVASSYQYNFYNSRIFPILQWEDARDIYLSRTTHRSAFLVSGNEKEITRPWCGFPCEINSMGFHGGFSMEFCLVLGHGIPWNFMEHFRCISMELHELKFIEFDGILSGIGTWNRPFYSCVPSDLASEWKRGWR